MPDFLAFGAVVTLLLTALACAVFSISHFLEKVNTFSENYENNLGG